ncbi:MAG: rhodanese-like domain-containing protein [Gallionella sp.]
MSMTLHELVAEAKSQIREIDVATAVEAIAQGVTLIDIREPGEFDTAHLLGALNIPRGVLEFKTVDHPALANKDRKIVIYCRSGGRAALSALNLQRLGFSQIVSMAGGIEAWVAANQAVVTDTTPYVG